MKVNQQLGYYKDWYNDIKSILFEVIISKFELVFLQIIIAT